MTVETVLLMLFGVVIFFQLFIMYVMYRRIKQQQDELDNVRTRMQFSESDLSQLVASVRGITRGLK
ncbi:MAG: hypothetical protein KO206_06655 [Methanomicrobiaceae archaeon]|uniref:Uncharacterized protein n=1 Tax=hydrocarbon metagenome TaxID=938273 RepID=A0A0W8FH02_9ZZZZ|nr:hypothetical protein [Methanomicrobiaceae archaeon]MDD5420232.1 hypothetical protein [Methanomicrobiaceae archaeon]